MSDQFGSFDNPYGGKPPFEGQEPPPPTPYATPQPYAAPQPTQPQQPQGWGQAPPAYGQYAMGQQPPAYLALTIRSPIPTPARGQWSRRRS